MNEARTSLNVVIIQPGPDHDTDQLVEALERLDGRGDISLGEVGVVERTSLGWLAPKTDEGDTLESLTDALDVPDDADPDEAAAALTFIGQHIPPGSQAVVAILAEPEGGALVDRELTQLGGTIHRRAAIEVFTDLEEAMEQQERRRTYRARAAKKLDKLVKNKIREELSPLERFERTVTRPFERLVDRSADPTR